LIIGATLVEWEKKTDTLHPETVIVILTKIVPKIKIEVTAFAGAGSNSKRNY